MFCLSGVSKRIICWRLERDLLNTIIQVRVAFFGLMLVASIDLIGLYLLPFRTRV